MEITTIGLDLAKSVFQVHGVDATGQVVVRRARRHLPHRSPTHVSSAPDGSLPPGWD